MENINLESNNQNRKEEMQMVVSGRLVKDGRKIVRVSFFRDGSYADAILPDAVIEKSEGFDRGELIMLEQYLKEHTQEIYDQAKTVNPMKNLYGFGKK